MQRPGGGASSRALQARSSSGAVLGRQRQARPPHGDAGMSDIPPSVALPPQSQERPLGSGFQAYTYPLTCIGS